MLTADLLAVLALEIISCRILESNRRLNAGCDAPAGSRMAVGSLVPRICSTRVFIHASQLSPGPARGRTMVALYRLGGLALPTE